MNGCSSEDDGSCPPPGSDLGFSDGWNCYPGAIEDAFGIDVTYGQTEKHYGVQAGTCRGRAALFPGSGSGGKQAPGSRVPAPYLKRPTSGGKTLRLGCNNVSLGSANIGACPARERSISLADIDVAAVKTALMLDA
jgi:hypothetical protein